MSERRTTVIAAIVANLAIAVTKFVVAAITGSGAMLSEGLHSVVDTGDGLLLLLGFRRSKLPPSPRHPYGHGLEVYFWSFVVAMAIFGAGGGVSIYEGIRHLLEPHEVAFSVWTYVVLGIAFALEGFSWAVAMRAFHRARGDRGVRETIEDSKDPTTFIVVLEDSAALLGILIAAAGITAAHALAMPALDAIASILIGLVLVAVSIVLGRETWSLMIGESATPDLVASIRAIAEATPGILEARDPRTMHLGPEIVHVDLDVRIAPATTAREILDITRRIEQAVRERHPEIHRVSLRFPDWSEPRLPQLAPT